MNSCEMKIAELVQRPERQWMNINKLAFDSPNINNAFSPYHGSAEMSSERKAFCYVYTNQQYSWILSFDSPQEIIRISRSIA